MSIVNLIKFCDECENRCRRLDILLYVWSDNACHCCISTHASRLSATDTIYNFVISILLIQIWDVQTFINWLFTILNRCDIFRKFLRITSNPFAQTIGERSYRQTDCQRTLAFSSYAGESFSVQVTCCIVYFVQQNHSNGCFILLSGVDCCWPLREKCETCMVKHISHSEFLLAGRHVSGSMLCVKNRFTVKITRLLSFEIQKSLTDERNGGRRPVMTLNDAGQSTKKLFKVLFNTTFIGVKTPVFYPKGYQQHVNL